ncbi:TetR family transcriptional regulator [Actinorhabdospora filicis]|uniref:TetR family transcriptional regulator n=1 Tax=Actinorhabdospora filicis TaxID=1785913 RepID=A0A9W6SPT8_9ACTN|nr:TetR/AcrR family transcriptional regulator [Actinorhabdospora filicis]GLZ79667.1 TetR family transcriptional regulator [Actinorhabdospora filicis]
MRRTAAETRELILSTAQRLFYGRGIQATGVDLIAAEAGIAPTSLYRAFPSKDALVLAYLEHTDAAYRADFDAAVAAAGEDPADRVLAVFDFAAASVRLDVYRGCAFLMALAEFGDASHAVHRAAFNTKDWVRTRFGELAAATGLPEPERLADRLALILEGVYASAQALGADGPAARARDLAADLLRPRA